MAARVLLPRPCLEFTGGVAEVAVSGATVAKALDEVFLHFPRLADFLLRDGELSIWVNIYVGDEDIRYLQGMATPIVDGDELSLVPAVAD